MKQIRHLIAIATRKIKSQAKKAREHHEANTNYLSPDKPWYRLRESILKLAMKTIIKIQL